MPLKGQKHPNPGGGRKKGSQNKITRELKEMILGALAGAGGEKYLQAQAVKNPAAFMTLLGKILPMTLAGDPKTPLEGRMEVVFVKAPAAIASEN